MMSKYIYLLLFSFALIFSCTSKEEVQKSDTEYENIKNYIESIKDEYININGIYRITIPEYSLEPEPPVEPEEPEDPEEPEPPVDPEEPVELEEPVEPEEPEPPINPEDLLTLSKGDTIEIVYVMSYFENGRDEVYYTNILGIAQENDLPEDNIFNTFEPKKIIYGETKLLKGIEIGLDGSKNKTEYGIIIPFEYGYNDNDKYTNLIPPYTTLYFEYKILSIKK